MSSLTEVNSGFGAHIANCCNWINDHKWRILTGTVCIVGAVAMTIFLWPAAFGVIGAWAIGNSLAALPVAIKIAALVIEIFAEFIILSAIEIVYIAAHCTPTISIPPHNYLPIPDEDPIPDEVSIPAVDRDTWLATFFKKESYKSK